MGPCHCRQSKIHTGSCCQMRRLPRSGRYTIMDGVKKNCNDHVDVFLLKYDPYKKQELLRFDLRGYKTWVGSPERLLCS